METKSGDKVATKLGGPPNTSGLRLRNLSIESPHFTSKKTESSSVTERDISRNFS